MSRPQCRQLRREHAPPRSRNAPAPMLSRRIRAQTITESMFPGSIQAPEERVLGHQGWTKISPRSAVQSFKAQRRRPKASAGRRPAWTWVQMAPECQSPDTSDKLRRQYPSKIRLLRLELEDGGTNKKRRLPPPRMAFRQLQVTRLSKSWWAQRVWIECQELREWMRRTPRPLRPTPRLAQLVAWPRLPGPPPPRSNQVSSFNKLLRKNARSKLRAHSKQGKWPATIELKSMEGSCQCKAKCRRYQ